MAAEIIQQDWQQRLSLIVETMRDMSRHTDPQEMVRAYAQRIQDLLPIGRRLSLSRRGLKQPQYRITRSTTWAEEINPWKEKDRLPLFEGGLLARLIYGDEAQVFDDLELEPDEPANEYLSGFRSLLAIPMLDQALESCSLEAQSLLDSVLASVAEFTGDRAADDDRTIIVARIT
jgi:phosphoserine phosphatase RsbU/P